MGTSNIDELLQSIRAEAALVHADRASSRIAWAAHAEITHVADFLGVPEDIFLQQAYRRILGREPDAAGASHYGRMLARGSLTRIEVLGRLAHSREARGRSFCLPGLTPAFVVSTFYRLPIVGALGAFIARSLRLPAHLQDRSGVEAIGRAVRASLPG